MFVRKCQATAECSDCNQPLSGETTVIVTDKYKDAGNEKAFLIHPDCPHWAFRDMDAIQL